MNKPVLFKRGTQERYDLLKSNNLLSNDTWYYCVDTHSLYIGLVNVNWPGHSTSDGEMLYSDAGVLSWIKAYTKAELDTKFEDIDDEITIINSEIDIIQEEIDQLKINHQEEYLYFLGDGSMTPIKPVDHTPVELITADISTVEKLIASFSHTFQASRTILAGQRFFNRTSLTKLNQNRTYAGRIEVKINDDVVINFQRPYFTPVNETYISEFFVESLLTSNLEIIPGDVITWNLYLKTLNASDTEVGFLVEDINSLSSFGVNQSLGKIYDTNVYTNTRGTEETQKNLNDYLYSNSLLSMHYMGSKDTYSDILSITTKRIGDVYNAKDTGSNYVWTGTEWDNLDSTIHLFTTHSNLLSNRDNNLLVPGKVYRIYDYSTSTSKEDSMSDNINFDILVKAISTNALDHNAKVTKRELSHYNCYTATDYQGITIYLYFTCDFNDINIKTPLYISSEGDDYFANNTNISDPSRNLEYYNLDTTNIVRVDSLDFFANSLDSNINVFDQKTLEQWNIKYDVDSNIAKYDWSGEEGTGDRFALGKVLSYQTDLNGSGNTFENTNDNYSFTACAVSSNGKYVFQAKKIVDVEGVLEERLYIVTLNSSDFSYNTSVDVSTWDNRFNKIIYKDINSTTGYFWGLTANGRSIFRASKNNTASWQISHLPIIEGTMARYQSIYFDEVTQKLWVLDPINNCLAYSTNYGSQWTLMTLGDKVPTNASDPGCPAFVGGLGGQDTYTYSNSEHPQICVNNDKIILFGISENVYLSEDMGLTWYWVDTSPGSVSNLSYKSDGGMLIKYVDNKYILFTHDSGELDVNYSSNGKVWSNYDINTSSFNVNRFINYFDNKWLIGFGWTQDFSLFSLKDITTPELLKYKTDPLINYHNITGFEYSMYDPMYKRFIISESSVTDNVYGLCTIQSRDMGYIKYPKGTIYEMEDEYGNNMPYDFKNIKFWDSKLLRYVHTFYGLDTETNEYLDLTRNIRASDKTYNNIIGAWRNSGLYMLPTNKFFGSNFWNNNLGFNCRDNYGSGNMQNNTIVGDFVGNSLGNAFRNNTVQEGVSNCIFNNTHNNYFGQSSSGNDFSSLRYSEVGSFVKSSTITGQHNKVGDGCTGIKLSGTSMYNAFGEGNVNITMGSGNNNNTIGNYNREMVFPNNSKSNIIGNNNSNFVFGGAVNGCVFDSEITNVTTTGTTVYSTFGSKCSNLILSNTQYSTFEQLCSNITCKKCNTMKFGAANSGHVIEGGMSYCNFINNCQNITKLTSDYPDLTRNVTFNGYICGVNMDSASSYMNGRLRWTITNNTNSGASVAEDMVIALAYKDIDGKGSFKALKYDRVDSTWKDYVFNEVDGYGMPSLSLLLKNRIKGLDVGTGLYKYYNQNIVKAPNDLSVTLNYADDYIYFNVNGNDNILRDLDKYYINIMRFNKNGYKRSWKILDDRATSPDWLLYDKFEDYLVYSIPLSECEMTNISLTTGGPSARGSIQFKYPYRVSHLLNRIFYISDTSGTYTVPRRNMMELMNLGTYNDSNPNGLFVYNPGAKIGSNSQRGFNFYNITPKVSSLSYPVQFVLTYGHPAPKTSEENPSGQRQAPRSNAVPGRLMVNPIKYKSFISLDNPNYDLLKDEVTVNLTLKLNNK